MYSNFWSDFADVKKRVQVNSQKKPVRSIVSSLRPSRRTSCPQTAHTHREQKNEGGMRRVQSAQDFKQIAAHQSVSEEEAIRVLGRPLSPEFSGDHSRRLTNTSSPIPEDSSEEGVIIPQVDSRAASSAVSDALAGESTPTDKFEKSALSEAEIAEEGASKQANRLEMARNLGKFLTTLCDEAEAAHSDADLYAFSKVHLPFAATKVFKNIDQFVLKLCEEAAFDNACLVHVLAYVDRIQRHSKVVLSWYNVHRLVLTGLMVADRMLSDDYKSGDMFAQVTGSPVSHMRAMQRSFLDLIDYNACVLAGQYDAYERWLLGSQDKETLVNNGSSSADSCSSESDSSSISSPSSCTS